MGGNGRPGPRPRRTVDFFRDASERFQVAEFLWALAPAAQAAVRRDLDPPLEFGLDVGFPTVRPVASVRKLWELRTKTADGAVRIFYVARTGRRFVLLHVFVKKSAKTPPQELATAVRRLKALRGDR